ncbi:MAG: GNAT family N-acetyltransferase [Streptococcaceae bacterium]|nr:GNAT family N-acetyltransferase [Streptococcaceae bacterium]
MNIRHVTVADLAAIYQIEVNNFSAAEAATYEGMKDRISKIPDTFLVAEIDGQVAGYIEGPAVATRHLTDDLFETVVENAQTGGYIAVTSLSVAERFKGQLVGTRLIAALKELARQQKREGINLTCHDYLIAYYEKNGFINEGQSQSTHGGAVWYDMVWDNLA